MSDNDYLSTIIKSSEAERMKNMVTAGFYDRSKVGLWLFEVIGREFDDIARWSKSLRDEAFPETCTWSIEQWEFAYGVEPDERDALEVRRGKIIGQKLTRPPINPSRIESAVYAMTGCPVVITENSAPYTFRIDVDETGGARYDHAAAIRMIRKIKPSHLSFRYESRIEEEFSIVERSIGTSADIFKDFFSEEIDYATDAANIFTGAMFCHIKEHFIVT